jgi:hypothetical protein
MIFIFYYEKQTIKYWEWKNFIILFFLIKIDGLFFIIIKKNKTPDYIWNYLIELDSTKTNTYGS